VCTTELVRLACDARAVQLILAADGSARGASRPHIQLALRRLLPSTSLRANAPLASGGAPCQSVIYCAEGHPQTPPRANSPASSSFLRPCRRSATWRLCEAASLCPRAAIHPRTPTTGLRPYPTCTGHRDLLFSLVMGETSTAGVRTSAGDAPRPPTLTYARSRLVCAARTR
jgi:hypothetical protein